MNIIRRMTRLYRPSTDPNYVRNDVEIDSRTLLDPDLSIKELEGHDYDPDSDIDPEDQDTARIRDNSLLTEDYFKSTFKVAVNDKKPSPEKDRVPDVPEASLLTLRDGSQELDDNLDLRDDFRPNYVPSQIIDYYNESVKSAEVSHSSSFEEINGVPVENKETISVRRNQEKPVTAIINHLQEATLKAKQRNALDDNQFGLPRLRAYPLNDAKHVKAAIRMFNHCKDPEDQKTLASNIFKAMKKFNVDTKIGEGNKLYQYASDSLKEAAWPNLLIQAVGKPMKERTKEDIVKEHLRVNADYYNTTFYGTEYANAITAIDGLDFLEVFYPNLRSMSFDNRLRTVIGGTANGGSYDPSKNWFRVNLASNESHTEYCKKLYAIMRKMLLDVNWGPDLITPEEMGVLLDWNPRVSYYYGLYQETKDTAAIQYLWDLFWNYNENPEDPHIKAVNVIALVSQMRWIGAQEKFLTMNEDNLIGRQELRSYLEKELEDDREIYLLPDTKEYPIIDQTSVHLAMDKIGTVPEKQRAEFSRNLNRRYDELGCTFAITMDHPYMKYASKAVRKNAYHVLMEDSSLPVDDQTHSTEDHINAASKPWYHRADYDFNSNWHNILDNKELGPNNLKQQRPDYSGGEALL